METRYAKARGFDRYLVYSLIFALKKVYRCNSIKPPPALQISPLSNKPPLKDEFFNKPPSNILPNSIKKEKPLIKNSLEYFLHDHTYV